MTKSVNHKIAFYIRVSTEEQAENPEGSIRNQEERLKSAVLQRNAESAFGEVVHTYIDRAKSGKDTNRSELQKMLIAIRKKEINLLMVSELSRVSRSIKDFADIWELMKASSCGFLSLRENFDTTTAAGEMVLYTVANIAQFERRQVSERVMANLLARSKRGLYNGGRVPLGYRIILDKPGYLEIDPEQAAIVRTVFRTFIERGSLSRAATSLNDRDISPVRETQGGGRMKRLSHFTVDTLHRILTNPAYKGARRFVDRGEIKEVAAAWPEIIEPSQFDRVQEILKQNCHKKPSSKTRYPYLLSGLTRCMTCGDYMPGKSAHGNGGKIGYYEHAWATKRNSTLTKKTFSCAPHRVQAKILEPVVKEQVRSLLFHESTVRALLEEANLVHAQNQDGKEIKTLKSKLCGFDSQLGALAEHLSKLPKSVSPAPIFKQMERIEELKAKTAAQLKEVNAGGKGQDRPAEFQTYQILRKALMKLMTASDSSEIQEKIIKRLIHKIEVGTDTVKVHYFVGADHIKTQIQDLSAQEADNGKLGESGTPPHNPIFLKCVGSNILTSGTRDRI
jgi:site-specific DNA recombinase